MNALEIDMPRSDYDAEDRVNWSKLKHMGRSPLHYLHILEQKDKDTPARAFGRAAHVAVLEPHLFDDLYAVWEGGRRAGKAWQEFQEQNAGREILTADDRDRCLAIAAAVRRDPIARDLITGGRAEVSMLWTHRIAAVGDFPEVLMRCKGRVDYASGKGIVDVKTCRDASPDAFGKDVWNMQYHVQAAWYVDGWRAATGETLPFFFIAAESEAPHAVQVYSVPDWILDHGRDTYRALLQRLDWCQRTGEWEGYATGELELSLPRWAVQPPDEDDLADIGITIGGA